MMMEHLERYNVVIHRLLKRKRLSDSDEVPEVERDEQDDEKEDESDHFHEPPTTDCDETKQSNDLAHHAYPTQLPNRSLPYSATADDSGNVKQLPVTSRTEVSVKRARIPTLGDDSIQALPVEEERSYAVELLMQMKEKLKRLEQHDEQQRQHQQQQQVLLMQERLQHQHQQQHQVNTPDHMRSIEAFVRRMQQNDQSQSSSSSDFLALTQSSPVAMSIPLVSSSRTPTIQPRPIVQLRSSSDPPPSLPYTYTSGSLNSFSSGLLPSHSPASLPPQVSWPTAWRQFGSPHLLLDQQRLAMLSPLQRHMLLSPLQLGRIPASPAGLSTASHLGSFGISPGLRMEAPSTQSVLAEALKRGSKKEAGAKLLLKLRDET